MNLENQVCSLELGKKLLLLGIKQDSYFYWFKGYDSWLLHYVNYNHWETDKKIFLEHAGEAYSAFIADELGLLLPNSVTKNENEPFNNFRIMINKFISIENNLPINNFTINYECDSTELSGQDAWLRRKLTVNIYDPNLANAMARMLIYLIENNLWKPNNA